MINYNLFFIIYPYLKRITKIVFWNTFPLKFYDLKFKSLNVMREFPRLARNIILFNLIVYYLGINPNI